jgi:hypothetical protein
MIRRKFEMADGLEIILQAPTHEGKKPLSSIWGDVIAWLLVLLLVFAMPFVMFFVAISLGFRKILGIASPRPRGMKEAAN